MRRIRSNGRKPEWWKRYLIGVAGGLAGTAAMSLYMKGIKSLHNPQQNKQASAPSEHDVSVIGRQHQNGESATAAIGRILYKTVKGREPDEQTKNKLSSFVHWGYGTDMGAAYALLRGRKTHLDWAGGLAYGAALWFAGDEIAVPLLGLAEGPKGYPKSLHAETLGAHLVYGVATAAATQLLERAA